MIEQFWGLERKPFANSPDPAFVYPSAVFDEAFARLLYDVTEFRGGLSLITGEVGCGKTMLASALVSRLAGTPHAVCVVASPRLTPVQLLSALGGLLGMEKVPRAKYALVSALGAHLAALYAAGRRPVMLVDEAQLCPRALLEEIRLLTNYEGATDKHLHVVLLGQPELQKRVAKAPQVDQRVSLRFHVEPLEGDEVAKYVRHRLGVAGANGRTIFDDGACRALAERSGGVPRLINNLATQALFVGAMRRLDRVDAALVHDVADDRA